MKIYKKYKFLEFFAGGGMARAGLGDKWECSFANDIDKKKAEVYLANWGNDHFLLADVNSIKSTDLPGKVELSWASFPCQDLSLAGVRAGLSAKRSGTFWPFWNLMRQLVKEKRPPAIIVLENVEGALSSHDGKDFVAIGSAFSGLGYRFGAVVLDAVHFLPQSRPRLFIIGVRMGIKIPTALRIKGPFSLWHPKAVSQAFSKLSKNAKKRWVWWNIPLPGPRKHNFIDIIEERPTNIEWNSQEKTEYIISLMNHRHKNKLMQVIKTGRKTVGGLYRRTRSGKQRAEVRFDDVAGCLRTPSGGSSRQTLIIVEGNVVRSRLLSPREAARLMGLEDFYQLPINYNDAYHLAGDGVAVPVVRHLSKHLIEPLLKANIKEKLKAA